MIEKKPNETLFEWKERLCVLKIEKEIDLDWSEIADLVGSNFSVDHFRRMAQGIYESYRARQNRDDINSAPQYQPQTKKTISTNSDGSQTSDGKFIVDNEESLRDPEYLLKLHNYDPSKWELVNSKNSFWDTQIKGGDIKTLYSSKVTVKPKQNGIDLNKIQKWYETLESKKVDLKQYNIDNKDKNCLVLPIADLHYNLLCTSFISGNKYNKKIAAENFYKIVNQTCERVKNKNITKILFVLGNDMFNANGINGTTFKGTPQTEEGHIFEAYIELSEIVINAIEYLTDVAMVDVIFIPSNHDKEVAYYFMYNINTYFRNNNNVKVDYSPLPRKYYRFGNTLFMLTHDIKISDVANTFLDEGGDKSKIVYYDCLLAHLHTEVVKQDKNLTIRRLPTTSPSSTWGNDNNFGSKQTNLSFIYSDKSNITDCIYVSV